MINCCCATLRRYRRRKCNQETMQWITQKSNHRTWFNFTGWTLLFARILEIRVELLDSLRYHHLHLWLHLQLAIKMLLYLHKQIRNSQNFTHIKVCYFCVFTEQSFATSESFQCNVYLPCSPHNDETSNYSYLMSSIKLLSVAMSSSTSPWLFIHWRWSSFRREAVWGGKSTLVYWNSFE